MMFELYTQEIKIKDDTYRVRPLSGKYLAKLYAVASKLGAGKEGQDMSDLDEDTVKALHEIVFETFKASYPNEEPDKLDLFVAQNLMLLMEGVFKVNMKAPDMA